MKSGSFMSLIADNYNDIVSLFKSRTYNLDMQFDEDAFGDTFIKCVQKFGDSEISYETAIKYFWVAYINTVKSNCIYSNKYEIISIDDATDIENDTKSIEYYDIIMDEVSKEFGDNDMNVYRLYKYHNWSKDELISAGFDCNNLNECIKTIHKYVKHYAKTQLKSS